MRGLPGALVLCGLVAFLVYSTSLPNGFAYDDQVIVAANPRVIDPARIGETLTSPYWGSRTGGGLYRPLTLLSYALNHRVGGLEPFGYHLVNVLLHVAVSLLVLLAAREFLGLGAALVAGLLFAAHPIHTEAVANVVGRAEIMASLGFLGAWRLHPWGKPGGLWLRRGGAAAAFVAGALSKEVALVFPLAVAWRDWVERRRPDLPACGLYAAGAVLCLALRYLVLGALGNPPGMTLFRLDNVIATLPLASALWTALAVFGRYLVLLVIPWRLSADYSYPQITAAGWLDPWAWLGLAGAAGLLAAAFGAAARSRQARDPASPTAVSGALAVSGAPAAGPGARRGSAVAAGLAVGLGIFGLTFLVVSNFVIHIGTVMGERLLYLPSAGAVLAAAAVYGRLRASSRPAGRRLLPAAVGLVVVVFGTQSLLRNRDWKDDLTIQAATVRSSPESARARYNHGVALHETGRAEEAVKELERAVALDPTYTEAWVNLGGYFNQLGRNAEATRALEKAVEADPRSYSALVNLGGLYVPEGRASEAIALLRRAVVVDSTRADAHFNLGLAESAAGDTAAAVAAYRRAVRLGPEDPDALNNLAWILALSGGPLDEARRHAERAVALKPDASTYDTLAEVLLRQGEKEAAAAAWSEALKRGAPNAAAIRERLAKLGVVGR